MIDKTLTVNKQHPFLWIGIFCLLTAISLARLNIYLGTRMNYLDALLFFNALTIGVLACASIAILLSLAGLWKTRFKSIPLALTGLTSSAFLVLLFLID